MYEDIIQRKKILRKEMAEKRAAVELQDRERLSREILEKLTTHEIYLNSATVMAYASMPEEIQLNKFFEDCFAKKKTLAIPFIVGRGMMKPVLLPNLEALERGDFGILTVRKELRSFVDNKEIDCIIVPGTAFDATGNRLGYGGGYYDKFLKLIPRAKKIALAYDFQVVEDLPVAPYDSKVDLIITPTKIISAN